MLKSFMRMMNCLLQVYFFYKKIFLFFYLPQSQLRSTIDMFLKKKRQKNLMFDLPDLQFICRNRAT